MLKSFQQNKKASFQEVEAQAQIVRKAQNSQAVCMTIYANEPWRVVYKPARLVASLRNAHEPHEGGLETIMRLHKREDHVGGRSM